MFKVGNKVVSSKYINNYVVEVKATFPKSEGVAYVEMGGFSPVKDDELLKDLLSTLDALINAYPNGRTDRDDYYHIPGYESWFAPGVYSDEAMESLPLVQQMVMVDWLSDPNGQPGSRATFDSYNIYLYDEHGEKWSVILEEGKMVKVHSSSLEEVGYDASARKLTVVFTSKAVYEYDGVPQSVYDELMKSRSIGSYFSRNIRNTYSYNRIA